jgi:hypothetical protein
VLSPGVELRRHFPSSGAPTTCYCEREEAVSINRARTMSYRAARALGALDVVSRGTVARRVVRRLVSLATVPLTSRLRSQRPAGHGQRGSICPSATTSAPCRSPSALAETTAARAPTGTRTPADRTPWGEPHPRRRRRPGGYVAVRPDDGHRGEVVLTHRCGDRQCRRSPHRWEQLRQCSHRRPCC